MEKGSMPVILIVDDQPANVFALERLLEDKERIVLTAASGPEANKCDRQIPALLCAKSHHTDDPILGIRTQWTDWHCSGSGIVRECTIRA